MRQAASLEPQLHAYCKMVHRTMRRAKSSHSTILLYEGEYMQTKQVRAAQWVCDFMLGNPVPPLESIFNPPGRERSHYELLRERPELDTLFNKGFDAIFAAAGLTDLEAEAQVLRLGGLSYESLSDIIGASINVIKSRLARARYKLRLLSQESA